MSEFGGLWKHENNQHALVPPKTPPMEERGKKEKITIVRVL